MSDIVEFLLARITEDETHANAAGANLDWVMDSDECCVIPSENDRWFEFTCEYSAHIANFDPRRVLGECATKRAIIELPRSGEAWCDYCSHGIDDRCPTVRALAASYSSDPDFDSGWTVEP